MNDKKDDNSKMGFFHKMSTAEHKGFEISMFSISVLLSLAVVISVIWLGVYFHNANAAKITDAEAEEGTVTESAVVADEDDDEPMSTPNGNAVISDTDDYEDELDPDLKDAEYGYTTAVVNLRSSASLTASVVTKVPMGVKVKLIQLTDDIWMKVIYKGQTGYIHVRYLSAKKVAPLATVKPTEEPQVTAAPTAKPTAEPTKKPKKTPKPTKTKRPVTPEPVETEEPADNTQEPTAEPTEAPTPKPTKEPTAPPEETKAPEQEKTNE